MSRSMIASLFVSAAVALLAHQAMAAPNGLEAELTGSALKVPGGNVSHVLLNTYMGTKNLGGVVLVPGAVTPVGTTFNVNCTNAAGCTVTLDGWAQFASAASQAKVAVCMNVDGSLSGFCPYLDVIPNTGGYFAKSHQSFAVVTQGIHTIDLSVYSDQASQVFNIGKEVKVYAP